MLVVELSLIFSTFMLYPTAAQEDQMASRGKLVYMKITGRERGAGTLRLPDHIYAEYQGTKHDFTCGRKYFHKMMAADSIEVRLDLISGKAALLGSGRVRRYTFLFLSLPALIRNQFFRYALSFQLLEY